MSAARLEAGVLELGLELDRRCVQRMLDYVDLLVKWNRAYNLTAVREPEQMITRHLLDSLAVLPHLPAGSLIDVGSGAGLPGIPLALAQPERPVSVLDSNGKKTRFLEHVKLELGLDQLGVLRCRVEDYRPGVPYVVVISRAFASLDAMITACRHLVADDGFLFAMKGQYPEAEVTALDDAATLVAVEELQIPGLQEARCLLRLVPSGQSSQGSGRLGADRDRIRGPTAPGA